MDGSGADIGLTDHIRRGRAVVWDVKDGIVLDSHSYVTRLERVKLADCKRWKV